MGSMLKNVLTPGVWVKNTCTAQQWQQQQQQRLSASVQPRDHTL
jgi:hypothetical protein